MYIGIDNENTEKICGKQFKTNQQLRKFGIDIYIDGATEYRFSDLSISSHARIIPLTKSNR